MTEAKGSNFTIVDKRGQEQDGSVSNPPSSSSQAESAEKPPPPAHELGEINFVTFLLSLYSSAMAAFGMLPSPADGQQEENIEGGKEMIDILEILKEKTKGNLNNEENQLLNNLLYELRMLYLEKKRAITL